MLHVCALLTSYILYIAVKLKDIVYLSVMKFTTTKTHTKTNTRTKTKKMTETKCSKDPSHAIFLKSWEFKDIRYNAFNNKDNDQKKTMTMTKTKTMSKTFRERPKRVILETCDLGDI